jgi:hypothetical protein
MANFKCAWTFEIIDVNGDTALMTLPTLQIDTKTIAQMVTASGALGALINPLTNGKVIKTGFRVDIVTAQLVPGATPPNDALWRSVTDGARLQFSNSLRERMSSTIPAPVETVFAGPTNVVDETQTDVAAFIALVGTDCTGASGTAFNLYEGGVKTGRGARQRISTRVP